MAINLWFFAGKQLDQSQVIPSGYSSYFSFSSNRVGYSGKKSINNQLTFLMKIRWLKYKDKLAYLQVLLPFVRRHGHLQKLKTVFEINLVISLITSAVILRSPRRTKVTSNMLMRMGEQY